MIVEEITMKLIKMTCPNCNAELEVDADRKQAFCQYCGTKLLIDDETINVNYRYIDEARVMEAQMKQSQIDMRFKRYEQEDREFEEKYAVWKGKYNKWKSVLLKSLGIGLAIMFVGGFIATIFNLSDDSAFSSFIPGLAGMFLGFAYLGFIFGGIYLYFTNPKNSHNAVVAKREADEESRILKEKQLEFEREKLQFQKEREDKIHSTIRHILKR